MKKICFIIISFQFYFANATVLKEDSLKSEFDIKDPRNPHCTCHKYQKLADEEYKKLLGKEIHLVADRNENSYSNSFQGNSEVNPKNKIGTKKMHTRNRTWSFFNIKKKKAIKRKKIKRLRKDNATCFHF